jgi:dGTPase
LEYKTQVFVNHEGDYYRTRLTHTLEVAQIARTIARILKLNEDLVEVIALAHDLGHTPFGHSGEATLNELMRNHGGFDHNTHGLRVVDLIEERYPDFPGLNLTSEVRRGIIKHATPFDMERSRDEDIPGPYLLEIQVVDIADEIAYDNHDLDDGLKSGLLEGADMAGIPIWDEAAAYVKNNISTADKKILRCEIVRYLINSQVSDIISNALNKLRGQEIKSPEDLDGVGEKLVVFSPEMEAKRKVFKQWLFDKLYNHYRVIRMSRKASRFLRALFENYVNNPGQLPPQSFKYIEKRGVHQVVCDYLAGMTDRYALDQYKNVFEPFERV